MKNKKSKLKGITKTQHSKQLTNLKQQIKTHF